MIYLSAFADEISADPTEQLDNLLIHSIRFVEFRSIHDTNVLDLTAEQHEEFREMLRERGMALSAIGSPIGKIKADEPFEPHLERLDVALGLCDFYECPRIRIFSFYIPEGGAPEDHREEVLRRMAAMAEVAEKRGVTLLLENEKGIYGDTADRVKEILDAVDSPALGHAFDPANYLEVGQPVDKAWTMLRDRVVHFHVKDYDTKTKKNVPAGEGEGQIPKLITDAVAKGFEGYCVLEPHLLVAEASTGFTGPERFGDAAVALQTALSREGVTYA
ncbi:sugar phosphate isomerase/epimerase family protein [Tautonia plasticadhaerens]|uniref:3-dehydroshikimate dehydratase n=1 Tax=Tautonia plasticadhaerens TaxID=2527974 RepID=A0A518H0A8_9BACT|nr:sugar phosphate isomerase/epimerase family protein [Tautonia plasticadhaerens]QDV34275.1 3-dehydroshikimate dehydratase [Tautonia plasticadhaerens]